MISLKSRIRRILKHLNGYKPISRQNILEYLPDKALLKGEEPIAIYQDPYTKEESFLLFTDKRLFYKRLNDTQDIFLPDIKEVAGPSEKDEASSLVLQLKGGQCLKISILSGDRRARPVFELVRLFDRLINDLGEQK